MSRISFLRRAQPHGVGDDSNILRSDEQQTPSEVAKADHADPVPASVDCDDLKTDQDSSQLTASQKKLRFFISSRSLNDPETKTLQPTTDLDNNNDDERVLAETTAGMGLFELQRNVASYRSLGNSIAENARDETLQQLNLVYDKKYRERQIKYQARVLSVRQTFAGSLIFMTIFLTGSVAFFSKTGNIPVPDAILFAFYTMTTCGFGSVVIPHTTPFLSYVIFYIFVSIAGLVILVSFEAWHCCRIKIDGYLLLIPRVKSNVAHLLHGTLVFRCPKFTRSFRLKLRMLRRPKTSQVTSVKVFRRLSTPKSQLTIPRSLRNWSMLTTRISSATS